MNATHEKIVDRVRKLLALATNNNSVEEAASALAAAQRLMSEHQIEQAMIEDAAPEEAPQPVGHETLVDDGSGRLAFYRWVVASALCDANGCKAYSQGRGRIGYIGRASDAQTVRYLFAYITAEIERLCQAGAVREDVRLAGQSFATRWRNSFRLGAAVVVAERLRETTRQAAQDARSGATDLARVETGLARIQDHRTALERYGKERLHLRAGGSSEQRIHGAAYEKGKQAGRGIGLGGGPRLGAPAPRLQGR